MSGDSSRGSFGSGGTGGVTDCRSFSFETHIHSPNPDEITKLSIGDQLDIDMDTNNGLEVIRLISHDANIVGGILENADRLKACLRQGYAFIATIRSISGAVVTIFITSRE